MAFLGLVVVWLVFGAVSFELVKTGHWIVGAFLMLVLLLATRISTKD
jgi:hypothetical protein